MTDDNMPVFQAVENVIELKPDKKYLLLFKGVTLSQLEAVIARLRAEGILNCMGIAMQDGQEVQVVAAPIPFLTINESRELHGQSPIRELEGD